MLRPGRAECRRLLLLFAEGPIARLLHLLRHVAEHLLLRAQRSDLLLLDGRLLALDLPVERVPDRHLDVRLLLLVDLRAHR